jgi:threonine aldolase
MIDLRSDTVTLPTDEMRAAMAAAPVGDDVYGEDPTLNRLEEVAAATVGKEAALFVPSGTMGNLLAVKCHTQPGDEVLLHRDSHILLFEMGGFSWFSGVVPLALDGERGILDPDRVRESLHTDVPYYRLRTTLVCVENTHNCGGGSVYPRESLEAIRASTGERGIPVHMDGARLFNAAVAQGVPAAAITAHADSVTFCLSKGLSAPVGSVLCGTREFVEKARRARRVVGGAMRQGGILAAAGLVALETMVDRLAEDHAQARDLANGLAEIPGIRMDPSSVSTNIVVCWPEGGAPAALGLVGKLKERGVLVSQLTPDSVRLVTHRHIGYNEVASALDAVRGAMTDL